MADTTKSLYQHIHDLLLAINADSPIPEPQLDVDLPAGAFSIRVSNIAFLVRRACGTSAAPHNVDITATNTYDDRSKVIGQHIAVVVSTTNYVGGIESKIIAEKSVIGDVNLVIVLDMEVDRIIEEMLRNMRQQGGQNAVS